LIQKYIKIIAIKETALKIKNILFGPIESSDIRGGQINVSKVAVPQRVSRQIPRAESIVVSAVYTQVTGPLVF
jgi:hypothetical protein